MICRVFFEKKIAFLEDTDWKSFSKTRQKVIFHVLTLFFPG